MNRSEQDRSAGYAPDRPLYARALRLRHLRPSGWACFLYCEGMFALGALLALAEAIPWWGVPVVPAVVAAMVKLNDTIAGGGARPPSGGPVRSRTGSPGGHGTGAYAPPAAEQAVGRLHAPAAHR